MGTRTLPLAKFVRRSFCTLLYPEQLQALSIKPLEFYETESAHKRYFYYIDLQVVCGVTVVPATDRRLHHLPPVRRAVYS
jgi:hypothetical protein